MTVRTCKEMGIANRQAVELLWEQGYSGGQIANKLGFSRTTVSRHLSALGLSRPCKPISAEEDGRILEMLSDGVSVAEIARTLNRSPHTLWRRYKGLSKATNLVECRKLRKQLGL